MDNENIITETNPEEEVIPTPDPEVVTNPQLEALMVRIPNDMQLDQKVYEDMLNNLLEDSKHIALSLKYPFEDSFDLELPKYLYNWQLRCSVELYQNMGKEGIVSYSENGLSWTKDSGDISLRLANEIIPDAGVPKVSEVVEDETNTDTVE